MNQSRKIYFLFLLIGVLILNSCEKDDYSPQQVEDLSLKTSFVNKSSYQNKKELMQGLYQSSAMLERSFTKSLMHDSINDFYVDDSRALYIQQSIYDSYTFAIEDPSDSTSIKNLLLSKQADDSYDAFLVKYNFNLRNMALIPQDSLSNYITISSINFDVGMIMAKSNLGQCIIGVQYVPGQNCGDTGNHVYPEPCDSGQLLATAPSLINLWGDCFVTSEQISIPDPNTNAGGGGASNGAENNIPCIFSENPNCMDNATGMVVMEPVDELCKEVADRFEEEIFSDKIADLKGKTGQTKEYGHVESSVNNFDAVESATNFKSISDIPISNTTIGMMHIHMDDFPIGQPNPNTGLQKMNEPIRIHSPGDITMFISLLRNASINNIALNKVYLTMVSSTGTYTLKYDGSATDIPSPGSINGSTAEEFIEKYELIIKDFGRQRGLLKFMKDEMGITNFSLYRTKDNGDVIKYYLEGDKDKRKKETCYEN